MAALAMGAVENGHVGRSFADEAVDDARADVREYIASLLPPIMSCNRMELERTLFADPSFDDKASRFASDPSVMAAWITKERSEVPSEEVEGQVEMSNVFTLHLPPLPPPSSSIECTLSLIKKRSVLDPQTPIGAQLHFLLLTGGGAPLGTTDSDLPARVGAPYEGLHSLVHWGMTPWFDAYVDGKKNDTSVPSKKGGEAQTGIPVTKRKFAELELALLHLQQNVEIPETHLVIHPAIIRAVQAAHEAGNRVTIDAVPANLLSDTPFLNRLQSDVNLWIKEIQSVTKLDRDVASGTASQEINFWLSMETALERIERQLASDEVNLVMDVLKSAKRFHATISFVSDTGLKEAMDQVAKYNALMKDFPLDELLSATDLTRIKQSLYLIFAHVNKKLRISPYPLRRVLPLMEAISSDFTEQCTKVLSSMRIMYMDAPASEQTMLDALAVFAAWDENMKEFTNVGRDVMRRRNEKFIPIKVNSAHTKLQERMVYLQAFRRTHEQLHVMTAPSGGLKSLGGEALTDIDMADEVSQAYSAIKNINVLDVSNEGTEIWMAAEGAYNERVTRVENQIIARLRDRLAAAKTAHEMFRVFSRFNSLFVRPKIRGAIQEYQVQLIESVKEDIKKLQRKFTAGYRTSQAYHASQLRDIPPLSGAIIWARQIARQLESDMQRVEDVLGVGWESYADGDKLKIESTAFRNKLDTTPLFDAWVQETTRRNLKIGGRLFEIVRQRNAPPMPDGSPRLELAVNFDSQAITLAKEVRNLLHLKLPVPHSIVNFGKEAKRVYPHVVSLMDSVRVYSQTLVVIEDRPTMSTLLANHRTRVQELIGRGVNIRWETISFPYMTPQQATANGVAFEEDSSLAFFKQFAMAVSLLQEKTTILVEVYEQIEVDIAELAKCAYSFAAVSERLARIQAVVDRLELEGFANLTTWLEELDARISQVMLDRLRSALSNFCAPLRGAEGLAHRATRHELKIRDQVIYLDPPIDVAKSSCLKQMQRVIGVVSGQRRLQCSRYEMTLSDVSAGVAEATYNHLLARIGQPLETAFADCRSAFDEVETYVDRWLQFQSLWDLDPEVVYTRLGEALGDWSRLLQEIRQSRSTFDTSESVKSFVICSIDYSTVQSKVAVKYDAWQRDILVRYSAKLSSIMRETHSQIRRFRGDLEAQTLDGSSTAQAVSFISLVQDIKKKLPTWTSLMVAFASGQTTLERQRYVFPADWLHADQVQGEWQVFADLLRRKDAVIQSQLGSLQSNIQSEDNIMEDKIATVQSEWEQSKPIQGDLQSDFAMRVLADFEGRITRLSEDATLLQQAKQALNMGGRKEDRLETILEEIRDLKAVWIALSGVWKQLDGLRETSWTSVQARKIRAVLDDIFNMLKGMPSRMRHYAAFQHVQDEVKALLKTNALVAELRSDAMRDRHWRQLFQTLRLPGSYRSSSFTLGQVYGMNLALNEKAIRDVLVQAQGEMALEEFLRQVKDTWNGYILDLVDFQNKCRLVRGWDDLFAKCGEHINSLAAMRGSPYFKVFEDEATAWSSKLNRIYTLFDVWVDVQRQWVYLEGIFSGNADIKHLLPVETARFNNINLEFMTTLKKVYQSPLVIDVLGIPGVHKTFERLAEALVKIQKALGEYLERERAAFPRFYFVGDEDLLEMLGNSKDTVRIVKHMNAMFAGIASLSFDADCVTAMISAEGEIVPLNQPIRLADYRKINEWLGRLEQEMQSTLAALTAASCQHLEPIWQNQLTRDSLLEWVAKFPAQVVLLSMQILWTRAIETRIAGGQTAEAVLDTVLAALDVLADAVLLDLAADTRRKCEHLITELVHQRDVTRQLSSTASLEEFAWQGQMRYYLETSGGVTVAMADARFRYGFEYLGVPDRLVTTPLTDRCYLTLTQALHTQLGGSPFGPAGTGKTETVKALGLALGRFVLVFCCDEHFDVKAMARIFVGLCQVGAWGCFDEFNRLEESMLSAISQQIQTIQGGLAAGHNGEIDLSGRRITLNPQTGIFVTMNPGYAGRSNLPDNLKKLFRSVAMTHPDKRLIAQVMLYSQGFRTAEQLATKIVPFFELCKEQLAYEVHYDFGLRALKSVLVRAGILKRSKDSLDEDALMIRSIRESIEPKLLPADSVLLSALIADIFRGVSEVVPDNTKLIEAIQAVCRENCLTPELDWIRKLVQLHQVQLTSHGLMLVGPSCSGKTSAWTTLMAAHRKLDSIEIVDYVIDPKAIAKDALYGSLDLTTREWRDGLFTQVLRRIVDNARGESEKRHWIVFDGDVDPEWVENLNSLLDDNKLLTLPNGERLALPHNVRVMFEVQDLRYATPATVSRCGMVYFGESTISDQTQLAAYLERLRRIALPESDIALQTTIASICATLLDERGLLETAIAAGARRSHVMAFSSARSLRTLFALLDDTILRVARFNRQRSDFPLSGEKLNTYITKRCQLALVWAFAGDADHASRAELSVEVAGADGPGVLTDFDVDFNAQWTAWADQVPIIEIDTQQITSTDIMIPTVDTIKHEAALHALLAQRAPVILCGPPGSGKTMTLFNTLRAMPDVELAGLNFSSATDPDLVLKTFEQYCEYRKSSRGTFLSPIQNGKWLVVFCDEINLPAEDTYGTQRVITFIRQMVERGGFWRPSDLTWVQLERIQFVGACNPPTDPGRVVFSQRFLRHAPVMLVDYPGRAALQQIYETFARAMLKRVPSLRGFSEALTQAMLDVYLAAQEHFTPEQQAHYVYSPREMSRWVRGLDESIRPLESLSVDGLVRIWAHEALRLFSDRLLNATEKVWMDRVIHETAVKHFPTIDQVKALQRPILFASWTTKDYVPVEKNALKEYTKARLRIFYEEELDLQLVLYDDFLDHALRIDRVFRQSQGHALLIGVSGSGKTTLARFVAWMNGLSIFQIKISKRYTSADFDDDLRNLLERAGCKGEKICFILDESNILDPGFLERMNTLLANAEIPGLFEGDAYTALMTACKEASQRDGLMLDNNDEVYRWFTKQVARNLHVVFTMNPPSEGLGNRAATSPALYNRCVIDWMGDWSHESLRQVAHEMTATLDLEGAADSPDCRQGLLETMLVIHQSVQSASARVASVTGQIYSVTPRHFLEFLRQFAKLFVEKKEGLEEQQRHIHVGLDKLRDTLTQVEELRGQLSIKSNALEQKDAEAKAKLRQMIADQQEAEAKKLASLQIQKELQAQDAQIAIRKEEVMADLAEAEPAVLEASAAVGNIKKQHLSEVRAMTNPPETVKLAMESACIVLGYDVDSWKAVQSVIRKDDFITSVQHFDTQQMSQAIRDRMERDYISRPTFNYETVNRASRACGPLVQWVIAQVRFSTILDRIQPLRSEVQLLERQAATTKEQAHVAQETITRLEASIEQYKGEYALLVSETQAIKGEMTTVQQKVTRSMTLLADLASEEDRWRADASSFQSEMQTVPADVLLAAAYGAYAGFFNQQYRQTLWAEWTQALQARKANVKSPLTFSDFLSTADDRAVWLQAGLPADNVCSENAVMLARAERYPLVIDPAGQALEYLTNSLREARVVQTSLLDAAFLKTLESALRFGNPLIVQDVESYDPVLNPILNLETKRVGGRVLVRLGKQEVDLSPSFRMFLITRDPSIQIAIDVCSRVNVVNFTMTPESLQSQCLDRLLQAERPDTERKRRELSRLQGDYAVRLRQLEKSLLRTLNESSGSILEDDNVVKQLEILKREAKEIDDKVRNVQDSLQEVEAVSADYRPVSQASSAIYFLLERLCSINHCYRFSLQYFFSIFDEALLHNVELRGVRDHGARRKIVLDAMFKLSRVRTKQALLHDDQLLLEAALADLFLAATGGDRKVLRDIAEIAPSGCESNKDLAGNDPATVESFLQDEETSLPAATALLLSAASRKDKFSRSLALYVDGVLPPIEQGPTDLGVIVKQVDASTPIIVASVAGFDASDKVDEYALASNNRLVSVAMGSMESEISADQALSDCSRTGQMLLLRNAHLSPRWLQQLDKRVHGLTAQSGFRLFISLEIGSRIPVNLLRQCRTLVYEPAPGIKASMLEAIDQIALHSGGPTEKIRLQVIVAFFHAVVLERLRFIPLGWTQAYEFSDADLKAALRTIDHWVDKAARGRSNLDPTLVPWQAIRTLLKTTVYGGKIDSTYDQAILDAFIDAWFRPESFDVGFSLDIVGSSPTLQLPDASSLDRYVSWIKTLPDRDTTDWLGLPRRSERMIEESQGTALLAKWKALQATGDAQSDSNEQVDGMSRIERASKRARVWLESLPTQCVVAMGGEASGPVARFFAREQEVASRLLDRVRGNLELLAAIKPMDRLSNEMRALADDINQGRIPASWKTYDVPSAWLLPQWIDDLGSRLRHIETRGASGNGSVKLGLLFQAEAYLTATQQAVAQATDKSLETLRLHVDAGMVTDDAFVLEGLSVEGATIDDGGLNLNDGSRSPLPPSSLRWLPRDEKHDSTFAKASLPVYLNSDRKRLLCVIDVALPDKTGAAMVAQLGVCVTAV